MNTVTLEKNMAVNYCKNGKGFPHDTWLKKGQRDSWRVRRDLSSEIYLNLNISPKPCKKDEELNFSFYTSDVWSFLKICARNGIRTRLWSSMVNTELLPMPP